MLDGRTLLLGMNNPLSDDARWALAPFPVNCAGWRLWQILRAGAAKHGETDAMSRADYMTAFERRNVLHSRAWRAADARVAGEELWSRLAGRRVVVLGADAAAACGLGRPELFAWSRSAGVDYLSLPHPSGRNRLLNDPAALARTAELMFTEYLRSREWMSSLVA